MSWPLLIEYSEAMALQSRVERFQHPDLIKGEPVFEGGTLLKYSGQRAVVYKVKGSDDSYYAVRCFTGGNSSDADEKQKRYAALSEYLKVRRPPVFVDFEYVEDGVFVKDKIYPIVKMEWVEGQRLDEFMDTMADLQNPKPEQIKQVCSTWLGACESLRSPRIAHNDLQHGNVMVKGDRTIRLVDYDGIYLPDYFMGQDSPETGEANYQHPGRGKEHYDENVDNFPALVIYLSLVAVGDDHKLWDTYNTGRNLILTKKDFIDPVHSECFKDMKSPARGEIVRRLADYLQTYCTLSVEAVPDLPTIASAAWAGQDDPPLRPSAGIQAPPQASTPPAIPRQSGVQHSATNQTKRPKRPSPIASQAPSAPSSPPPSPAPNRSGPQASRQNRLWSNAPTPGRGNSTGSANSLTQKQQQAIVQKRATRFSRPYPWRTGRGVECPACNKPDNRRDSIFCEDKGCVSELIPAEKEPGACLKCRSMIPRNSRHCRRCGAKTDDPREAFFEVTLSSTGVKRK